MNASDLAKRASFYQPVEERDADGMLVQGWLLRFTCAANVCYLRGSEAVMQARLQSKAPAIVTVRDFPQTRQVTSEWRVEIDGRTFHLKEDPRPEGRMQAMLVEG
ncbi:head-tail adaptor protein [uncultured Paracoccus sp.]|uniref:head-tail adaptor protein n=1 Tax=uncultured Paracoccus sp. TaxID=189685 RepID=UPI00262246D0|nr:head-tail adaptor protein [uncultured Paracoccus sp.]